jgi:DNA-binding response OmpR family regulator
MNFDTRGQRVLIFENDRAVLEMLQIRFDVAGYHIMSARNGMAAIEMLGVMRPDVVIMEMALPEADGFRILEVLRQRYGMPPFPILIMGRALAVVDIRRAVALGARDCLAKPFSGADVLTRVSRLLQKRTDGPAMMASAVQATPQMQSVVI